MIARRLNSVQEYYFSKKLREVAAMIEDGKPIINMGIGSPDLPAHPNVVDALKESFDHPKVHQYQSYQGLHELRKAIADFYKKYYNLAPIPIDQDVSFEFHKEFESCREINLAMRQKDLSAQCLLLGELPKIVPFWSEAPLVRKLLLWWNQNPLLIHYLLKLSAIR